MSYLKPPRLPASLLPWLIVALAAICMSVFPAHSAPRIGDTARAAILAPKAIQVQVVDAAGLPIEDAIVYHHAAKQQIRAGLMAAPDPEQTHLATDTHGYLQDVTPVGIGDKLVAMELITATDTYSLYHTSAAPTVDGLAMHTVTTRGVQTLAVTADNPLILFNLTVSVEWDLRADAQYRALLQSRLRRTAEIFYDLSNGQATLGDMTVYHNREAWETAHIRIYATNRLRPNAVRGGIVTEEKPNPADRDSAPFYPGQVRMGAVWNRYGDPTANEDEDWSNTLAHELGHFAFFLDDNYLGLDEQDRLFTVTTCPGAMTDPYTTANSEFHPDKGWDSNCENTLSDLTSNRSDWSTITLHYPLNKPGPDVGFGQVNPGPNTLELDLPIVNFIGITLADSELIPAPFFPVEVADTRPGENTRAYLFQKEDDDFPRIVDLGRPDPITGEVHARGARIDDRLCVIALEEEQLKCDVLERSRQPFVLEQVANWQPDLILTPVTSTTIRLEVMDVPTNLSLKARLYPTNGQATTIVSLTPTGAGYQGNLNSSEMNPAFDGLVHLYEDSGQGREAVIDFRVGGNPGRKWSRSAPRSNPGRKWSRSAPILSTDGQAILFTDDTTFDEGDFFAVQAATNPPDPPSYATPVGRAYRITTSTGVSLGSASLNIGYPGVAVPQGQEANITVYRWDESSQKWQSLDTRLDPERNEASAAAAQPGVYRLMTSVVLDLTYANRWNEVSFYPGATQPIPEAMAGIAGIFKAAYGYDEADSDDPWKVYDVDVPEWINDLDLLAYEQGYWIWVSEAVNAPIRGFQRQPQTRAGPTQGFLPLPPATYYYEESQYRDERLPPVGTKVEARINTTLCGRSQVQEVDGQRVFIVDVSTRAEQSGCGVPGAVVTLMVGDQTFGARWERTRPQRLTRSFDPFVYLPLILR